MNSDLDDDGASVHRGEDNDGLPQQKHAHSPYKPPKPVNLREILEQDANDESLIRYKQKLLPSLQTVILDEKDPRCVLPESIHLLVFDANTKQVVEDINFSLNKSNIDSLKTKTVELRTGCPYKFRVHFRVQRDIVTGLQLYVHLKKSNVLMQGLITEKSVYMIGSHAPTKELKTFESHIEFAPKGPMAKGKYLVKSSMRDDYCNEYVKWEWNLRIVGKDESDDVDI